MSWRECLDLPFHSMLEFGSNVGAVYRYLRPADYLGMDIAPQWHPDPPHAVVQADVMTWEPPNRGFDLVFCDAHGGVDSPNHVAITKRQVTLAKRLTPKWIAVDDCWVPGIRAGALAVLGQPWRASEEGTQTWVWQVAA
jgi:hypothetical protein